MNVVLKLIQGYFLSFGEMPGRGRVPGSAFYGGAQRYDFADDIRGAARDFARDDTPKTPSDECDWLFGSTHFIELANDALCVLLGTPVVSPDVPRQRFIAEVVQVAA